MKQPRHAVAVFKPGEKSSMELIVQYSLCIVGLEIPLLETLIYALHI